MPKPLLKGVLVKEPGKLLKKPKSKSLLAKLADKIKSVSPLQAY